MASTAPTRDRKGGWRVGSDVTRVQKLTPGGGYTPHVGVPLPPDMRGRLGAELVRWSERTNKKQAMAGLIRLALGYYLSLPAEEREAIFLNAQLNGWPRRPDPASE